MIIALSILIVILLIIGIAFYKYVAPTLIESESDSDVTTSTLHKSTVRERGLWGNDPFHSGSVSDEESHRTLKGMEDGPMNAPLDTI
jgi:hypothetical protein